MLTPRTAMQMADCPVCGAKAGSPCRDRQATRGYVHTGRFQAAERLPRPAYDPGREPVRLGTILAPAVAKIGQPASAIKARPTQYKGILMRSRLEADFAGKLDAAGCTWEYEPTCFAGAGGQWLPDFHISEGWNAPCYVELKPVYLLDAKPGESPAALWARLDLIVARLEIAWETDPGLRLVLAFHEYGQAATPRAIITALGGATGGWYFRGIPAVDARWPARKPAGPDGKPRTARKNARFLNFTSEEVRSIACPSPGCEAAPGERCVAERVNGHAIERSANHRKRVTAYQRQRKPVNRD